MGVDYIVRLKCLDRRKRTPSPQPSAEPPPRDLITLDERSTACGCDLFAGDWRRVSGLCLDHGLSGNNPVVPAEFGFEQVRNGAVELTQTPFSGNYNGD
jgi:hypothetical protein